MRERLIELIESTRYWGAGTSAEIADHLLANGVICPPCNELKPEDVMRALECCKEYENDDCPEHCPLYECETCNMPLFVTILREKDEEIERLNDLVVEGADYNEAWVKDNADLRKAIKTTRSEAITEFAERVKLEFYREFDEIIPSFMADKIDQIAEEMKGATDD